MRPAVAAAADRPRGRTALLCGAVFGAFLWLFHCAPVAPLVSPPLTELPQDGDPSHRITRPLPYAPGSPVVAAGYAGYIPIRTWTAGSTGVLRKAEMFYWLFPRQDLDARGLGSGRRRPRRQQRGSGEPDARGSCSPLIMWLQGGPGASSMIGLFTEMGPYRLNEEGLLYSNLDTWAQDYPIVFVDQPVGTGYSFVEPQSALLQTPSGKDTVNTRPATQRASMASNAASNATDRRSERYTPEGYVKGQEGVGKDMTTFLLRFFGRYPDLRRCGLYVTGESYAGKFVPAIATHILKHNDALFVDGAEQHSEHIDLKGIAVGNGLTDPASQIYGHAQFALQNGLISVEQATILDGIASRVKDAIAGSRFPEANDLRKQLLSTLNNFTGDVNLYDIRQKDVAYNRTVMHLVLNRNDVRVALHVLPDGGGDEDLRKARRFGEDPAVYDSMKEDIMQSAAYMFPALLERGIKVLLYQGQFDMRDGAAAQTEWIHGLDWSGKEGFSKAARRIWRLRGAEGLPTDMAGYIRKHRNLVRAEVLGAGHLAPSEGNAPQAMRDLIRRFVEDEWD